MQELAQIHLQHRKQRGDTNCKGLGSLPCTIAILQLGPHIPIASVGAHMANKHLIFRVLRQCDFMQKSIACLFLVYSNHATLWPRSNCMNRSQSSNTIVCTRGVPYCRGGTKCRQSFESDCGILTRSLDLSPADSHYRSIAGCSLSSHPAGWHTSTSTVTSASLGSPASQPDSDHSCDLRTALASQLRISHRAHF